MSRGFDSIKDINDGKELWKFAVRLEDMWKVGVGNGEHIEFLILDKQVWIRYRVEVEVRFNDYKFKYLFWDRECNELIGKSPSEFMISQLPENRTRMKLKCKLLPRGQSKNLPMKSHFHEKSSNKVMIKNIKRKSSPRKPIKDALYNVIYEHVLTLCWIIMLILLSV
ncbi:hypothetical protein QL285_057397 [Trifolium repens]|nr:hypothetical protein QL285_057397 [Trifolium repens]